jgi:hypothetical protein
MSENTIQINVITPNRKQDWTDLNKDGKKMNKVLLMCYTKITPRKNKEALDDATIMGFIQCICRLTQQKSDLVKSVLGIKQVLEDAKKR